MIIILEDWTLVQKSCAEEDKGFVELERRCLVEYQGNPFFRIAVKERGNF